MQYRFKFILNGIYIAIYFNENRFVLNA